MPRYTLVTGKTWDETIRDLGETFRKWNRVSHWTVEPIRPKRASNQSQNEQERSVTVRYTLAGRDVTLTMATQERAHDNLRVLYLAVEALRLNEARGIAEVVASAYLQLPAPAGSAPMPAILGSDPYNVLGLTPGAPLSVAEAAYRTLAKTAHPSAGGDRAAWDRLQGAIEAIRKEKQ